jgi:hypothetical protein
VLFGSVGNLVLREIILNRYFRPFRPLELRSEYDRLRSVPLLDALARLGASDRAPLTIAFVTLFRLLHDLSCISNDPSVPIERRSRVVLALVRGEAQTLGVHLKSVADTASSKRLKDTALKAAKEILRKSAEIPKEVLSRASELHGTGERRAARELTALFQEHIIALAQAIDTEIPDGEAPFLGLVSSVERAVRLRQDLWGFHLLCQETASALRGRSKDGAHAALLTLRRYIAYFHDTGFQLLRFGDAAAFEPFFALVFEMEPTGPSQRQRLAEDCDKFVAVLRNRLAGVQRRADLAHVPFEGPAVRRWIDRFRVT